MRTGDGEPRPIFEIRSARGGGSKTNGNPPEERFCVWVVSKLDQERTLPDVGRDAFELEGLKPCPTQQIGMSGRELAEILGNIFIWVSCADGLLLCP